MASIVIKDLTEGVELDRRAMHAIVGGSRSRGHQNFAMQAASTRILNIPGGVRPTAQVQDSNTQSLLSLLK